MLAFDGEGDMNIQKLALFTGVFLSFLMLSQSSFAWEGSYYPSSSYTTQSLTGSQGHQRQQRQPRHYNRRHDNYYDSYLVGNHSDQRYSDYRYQHSYPVLDVVFSRPFGAHRVVFNKTDYYYNSGTFYRKCGRQYDVVLAPVGALVHNLPRGYQTSIIHNRKYFHFQGTYFRGASQGYEVVADPYLIEASHDG